MRRVEEYAKIREVYVYFLILLNINTHLDDLKKDTCAGVSSIHELKMNMRN